MKGCKESLEKSMKLEKTVKFAKRRSKEAQKGAHS